MTDLTEALAQLEAAADPPKAPEMAAYHKAPRRYLGVTVPQITALADGWRAATSLDDRIALARALWAADIHESRIAAAKLSAKATIGVAELGAVGAAAVEAATSVIGPRQGQGALEKRAGTLMADASALSRKALLIRRELRSIGEIIRRPIRDLRL